MKGTPYKQIRPIGSGAMGEVIEAEHRALGKRVVVKLIRAKWADSALSAERFRLEAQALACLDRHLNIVQVFDYGRTPDNRPYLVMERLEGQTLRQEMAMYGPFDVIEAMRLIRQVLSGLEAVHARGFVHRDIKPSNLFLCDVNHHRERLLKILDFGVVKLLKPDAGGGPVQLSSPTAEGVTIGTPRYLAPEQALGRPVDGRADLYSVGAVLYWMITGKDPFHDQGGELALIQAHINRTPTPVSMVVRAPLPPGLDHAILKALAKLPEDRFASATQFREELERVPFARPPRWLVTERINTSTFRVAATNSQGQPLPSASAVALRSDPERTIPCPPNRTIQAPGRSKTAIPSEIHEAAKFVRLGVPLGFVILLLLSGVAVVVRVALVFLLPTVVR